MLWNMFGIYQKNKPALKFDLETFWNIPKIFQKYSKHIINHIWNYIWNIFGIFQNIPKIFQTIFGITFGIILEYSKNIPKIFQVQFQFRWEGRQAAPQERDCERCG